MARGPFVEEFYQCVTYGFYTAPWQEQLYASISLLLMFVLPLTTLVVTYAATFRTIASEYCLCSDLGAVQPKIETSTELEWSHSELQYPQLMRMPHLSADTNIIVNNRLHLFTYGIWRNIENFASEKRMLSIMFPNALRIQLTVSAFTGFNRP